MTKSFENFWEWHTNGHRKARVIYIWHFIVDRVSIGNPFKNAWPRYNRKMRRLLWHFWTVPIGSLRFSNSRLDSLCYIKPASTLICEDLKRKRIIVLRLLSYAWVLFSQHWYCYYITRLYKLQGYSMLRINTPHGFKKNIVHNNSVVAIWILNVSTHCARLWCYRLYRWIYCQRSARV